MALVTATIRELNVRNGDVISLTHRDQIVHVAEVPGDASQVMLSIVSSIVNDNDEVDLKILVIAPYEKIEAEEAELLSPYSVVLGLIGSGPTRRYVMTLHRFREEEWEKLRNPGARNSALS